MSYLSDQAQLPTLLINLFTVNPSLFSIFDVSSCRSSYVNLNVICFHIYRSCYSADKCVLGCLIHSPNYCSCTILNFIVYLFFFYCLLLQIHSVSCIFLLYGHSHLIVQNSQLFSAFISNADLFSALGNNSSS